ncbi:LemA family protein [Parvularcula marina]|uniref:LemA family protein n=1 Tax=Parvularcula marina TaxID=2292771 RepID=A0A371RKI0_9PROT|nr:LemA family protein [Parvularcula marina]RFB05975.1 LemA family protein [Parvularcula marina]
MELIVPAVLVIIAAGAYFWYVSIIGRRNKVKEALGSIDAHLQLRSDLIPNLLRAAQRFLSHEEKLLTEITVLRSEVTKDYDRGNGEEVKQHLNFAEQLSSKLGQLRVQIENYPDLKGDGPIEEAMETMSEVEAQITAARRFYNSAVTDLNNSVEIFPGSVIANMAGVSSMPYYEAAEASRAPINADDYLNPA